MRGYAQQFNRHQQLSAYKANLRKYSDRKDLNVCRSRADLVFIYASRAHEAQEKAALSAAFLGNRFFGLRSATSDPKAADADQRLGGDTAACGGEIQVLSDD